MSRLLTRHELQPRASSLFPERRRLAADLQRLRLGAGLSTYELAEMLGVSQSKVSKIENGRVAVSAADAAAWARVVGAPPALAAEVSERALAALTDAVGWRASLHSLKEGMAERQREIAALELEASAVRCFSASTAPGLLQTPEYARWVFAREHGARGDVDAAVDARLARQAAWREGGKELEVLLSEVALRSVPRALAPAQLDRLWRAAGLPAVRLGIVPVEGFAQAWMGHGFTLFEAMEEDADLVHVETLTAVVHVSDPDDVRAYRDALDRLRAVAVHGDDAVAWIARVMGEMAGRPER